MCWKSTPPRRDLSSRYVAGGEGSFWAPFSGESPPWPRWSQRTPPQSTALLESDVTEPGAGKDKPKSRGEKGGARVTVDGETMTVKEMQKKMGSPGKEFFQSSRSWAGPAGAHSNQNHSITESNRATHQ